MPTISFKGKPTVETLHLTIPYHQLIPDLAASQVDKTGLDGFQGIFEDEWERALSAMLEG